MAQGLIQVETLDEPLKSLLARTPARSLSLSGSYELSPSFKRSVSSVGSLKSTGKLMSEWVLVEEVQSAIEKFQSKCRKGRKCCEKILLCFRISKVRVNLESNIIMNIFESYRLIGSRSLTSETYLFIYCSIHCTLQCSATQCLQVLGTVGEGPL